MGIGNCPGRFRAKYRWRNSYIGVPGPNCNTFVAEIIEQLKLGITLPAGAIGAYYTYFIAGMKVSNTRVQSRR